MGKGILEQIEETLALENNNKFGRAIDTLNDSTSAPKKREQAKKTVIKTVAAAFRKDGRFEGYLSESDRNQIENELKSLDTKEAIPDNDLTKVLGTVESKCYEALQRYYISDITHVVHAMAKKIECTTAKSALETMRKSDPIAKKKSIIKGALTEMLIQTRQKAHTNAENRKVSKNMKDRLEILINMTNDICTRTDTNDKIDYWILRDDVVELMKREYKAYQMIKQKLDAPLNKDEEYDKDKKRGKNMENEKKTTALVPYKAQPLALQRKEVKGKTEKPIEKPKKNWKKNRFNSRWSSTFSWYSWWSLPLRN